MSVESLAAVFNHSRARGSARLVLLVIANHDGEGGAWPSLSTISRLSGGLDRKYVKRLIEELVELGELQVAQGAGGTSSTPIYRRPNRYEVLVSCPEWCDRTRNHRDLRGLDVPLPISAPR